MGAGSDDRRRDGGKTRRKTVDGDGDGVGIGRNDGKGGRIGRGLQSNDFTGRIGFGKAQVAIDNGVNF